MIHMHKRRNAQIFPLSSPARMEFSIQYMLVSASSLSGDAMPLMFTVYGFVFPLSFLAFLHTRSLS